MLGYTVVKYRLTTTYEQVSMLEYMQQVQVVNFNLLLNHSLIKQLNIHSDIVLMNICQTLCMNVLPLHGKSKWIFFIYFIMQFTDSPK